MTITPFYRRLDFKIILGLIISLLVVGLPFFIFFYNFHKEQLVDSLKVTTTNLSRLVVSTLESAMLKNERYLLNEQVKRLSEQSGVVRIMILNKKGELKVSSDPLLLGKIFNHRTDPMCSVCHKYSPIRRNNTTIARNEHEAEFFRNMSLIYNQPRCYGCHDENEKINGILVMDLSMSDTRRQLASNNRVIIGMATFMVLVTIIVLGILINKLILKRIRKFTDTTLRISEGNLNEIIEFAEQDEISDLAASFNNMTANLKHTLHEVERHKEYLEYVINGIDDEIVVVDRELKIVTANKAYLNRCKGSRQEILGSRCTLRFYDDNRPCNQAAPDGCPAKVTFEQGVLHKTLRTFLDRDGHEKYLEIYCSPLFDEHGKVFQVIELRRDITERKFLEEQLIHTEKLTSIGRLSASVAHEINNPLDGIQNCLDIIKKNPNDTVKTNAMFELISEGIKRIAFIVRRLLVFSRHHKLKMEWMNLNAVLETALLLVKQKIEDQGIRLSAKVERPLPSILGDPYNISQVFVNVLINAADALDGKSDGRIVIQTKKVCQNSETFVLVKISDNGCGIAEDNLERIFSPFFTTKDPEKGTGLGLSICKKIVEEHGGTIELISEVDEGTEISICIPVPEKQNEDKNISC